MYNETRIMYYKDDVFEPKVELVESFGPDEESMVKLEVKSFIVDGQRYMGQQVVLKFDIDHAKLLVAKLQEGIDKHENKA